MPTRIVAPPAGTANTYGVLEDAPPPHFVIDWEVLTWAPLASVPAGLGWKGTSEQRERLKCLPQVPARGVLVGDAHDVVTAFL